MPNDFAYWLFVRLMTLQLLLFVLQAMGARALTSLVRISLSPARYSVSTWGKACCGLHV